MDLALTGEVIARIACSVWVLGMLFHATMCLRDIRMSMHVEQHCRDKNVKNYYTRRAREATRALKFTPVWPILLVDFRETVKAIKRYRELNKR